MMYPNAGPMRAMAGPNMALLGECVAAALFALLAGVSTEPAAIAASFAAAMLLTSFVSGSHINPSVTIGGMLSGHTGAVKGLLYIMAQVVGTLAGTSLLLLIAPGVHGGDPSAAACHGAVRGLGGTPLYLWETLLTFVFVFVLYGAIFNAPGHGPVAPLTAGITLFACLAAGGQFTGLSPLNPAVTLSSALVFDCHWGQVWKYLLAQFTGAGLAAALAVPVYGIGPYMWDRERRAAFEQSVGTGWAAAGGYQPLSSGEERGSPAPQGVPRAMV